MSDTASVIQNVVYRGYGIAAGIVGVPHDHFRPTDPMDPLRLLDLRGRIRAVFDARPSLKFSIPALHNDAARYAVVDGNAVKTGDYLVGPQETVFVAGMPALQSIVCVACNARLTLRNVRAGLGFGAIEDRSPETSEEIEVFRGWPVSLLYAGRGGGDDVQLPGDAPPATYNVLMPVVPNVPIPAPGDIMVDEHKRRYAVGWCEVAHLGWRMVVRHLVTD